MPSRHLTRNGRVPVFQIRVPKALDPESRLAPIRVTIGQVPNSRARRIADILAGMARYEFERIRSSRLDAVDPAANRRRIERQLTAALPTLLGLAVVDRCALPDDIREPALEAVFDSLSHIGCTRAMRPGPSARGPFLEVPIVSALQDENVARGMLGMKPVAVATRPDPVMAELAVIRAMLGTKEGPKGPLFSTASERFVEGRKKTYGDPDHPEIRYLEHRRAIFLAIIGDKPIDSYTRTDLQDFVNEIAWLPPNVSKQEDYDVARVRDYIAANKALDGQGLAAKTIRETYLSRIKTMLRETCADAKVPIAFEGRIVIPKRAAPAKARFAPDQEEFGRIVEKGIGSGILADALLPALGQLTGRRLGLLAFMRRENIMRYNGVWVYRSQSHQLRDGRWVPIPFKTDESLGLFVLHDLFKVCGFIDWALNAPGPVFPMLMQAKDPADAAQKRMSRLYTASGADPRRSGTFHGLRAGKIRNDRDLELPSRAVRLQVGHELTDVHEKYDGQMTDKELKAFATAPLPPGVNWKLLSTIDYEAFAYNKPKGGRPKKAKGVGTMIFCSDRGTRIDKETHASKQIQRSQGDSLPVLASL